MVAKPPSKSDSIAVQKVAIDSAFNAIKRRGSKLEMDSFQLEFLHSHLEEFKQQLKKSDNPDTLAVAEKAVSAACDFILSIDSLEWDDYQTSTITSIMKGGEWVVAFKKTMGLDSSVGGAPVFKKTHEKVNVCSRTHVVYTNKRGTKYIRSKGEYVLLSKMKK